MDKEISIKPLIIKPRLCFIVKKMHAELGAEWGATEELSGLHDFPPVSAAGPILGRTGC